MAQCKAPLNWKEPNINICIKEEGHAGPHYTYGLGWDHIHYPGFNVRQFTQKDETAKNDN